MPRRSLLLAAAALAAGSAALAACSASEPPADLAVSPETSLADRAAAAVDRAAADRSLAPVTLVGAGDIAWCEPPGVGSGEVTAKLLDALPGAIFTVGDNSNGNGTLAEYQGCFGPSWGRHLARIRPAPGNHDYTTAIPDGADYHAYFGAAAGPKGKGYYSYDLGAWHIVVLNSECNLVSCAAGSEQETWLRADLAAHPSRCTLAIMHRPHLSYSSPTGSSYTRALFAALHAAGVDLLLSGHYHWYERFRPMGPDGKADPAQGIRQFIVGTGGSLPMFNTGGWIPESELHLEGTFGVLKLTLHPDRYDWSFIPEAGKTATDSGTAPCH
jgi:hypothetical protein